MTTYTGSCICTVKPLRFAVRAAISRNVHGHSSGQRTIVWRQPRIPITIFRFPRRLLFSRYARPARVCTRKETTSRRRHTERRNKISTPTHWSRRKMRSQRYTLPSDPFLLPMYPVSRRRFIVIPVATPQRSYKSQQPFSRFRSRAALHHPFFGCSATIHAHERLTNARKMSEGKGDLCRGERGTRDLASG